VDEAGARARIQSMTRPPNIQDSERDIEKIKEEKEAAIKAQDFELAASLRDKEKQARERLEQTLAEWRQARDEKQIVITEDDIMQIVAKWTGIPLSRMEQKDTEKLLAMEGELRKTVIGQDEAVIAISKALRRSRADLKDPNRPIGSFVFLGPTGVGKTLMARALAEFMFGDQDALIQLDMSEYMEKFNVSRLVGSPPGYVGYEEGGQLTERVRRRPYSVVLFDEIEKAHPDVMNMLLQILEDGHLTDSLGTQGGLPQLRRHHDLEHRRGHDSQGGRTRFRAGEGRAHPQRHEGQALEEAKRVFKPEFMNRLDDLIVFHTLTKADMGEIVHFEVEKVKSRLKYKDVEIALTSAATDFLIEKGYDPQFGARPLRRAVEKYLQDPLAEEILRGNFKPNEIVEVTVGEEKDKLVFNQLTPTAN
jgi:ATP-dependent Clp protease ATP-binding subunit ClpC